MTSIANAVPQPNVGPQLQKSVQQSSLHKAAERGDSPAVAAILAAGVLPNVQDGLGQTALLRAAWWGHNDVVQLLIKAGIDVNAKSELGFDALFWAVNHGHVKVVDTLLAAGANVNATGLHGWTALHEAAKLADSSIFEKLVAHGALLDAKDAWGETPAMIKAESAVNTLLARWLPYLNSLDWQAIVLGIEPKITPCGPIYELENPAGIGSSNESFAIADMRAVSFCSPHYHANNETEIYVVLQGTGLVVVGGEEKYVQKGDVIVTPPGMVHFTIPEHDLVLGMVNTPPFNPANIVAVHETELAVGFDKAQFDQLTAGLKQQECCSGF